MANEKELKNISISIFEPLWVSGALISDNVSGILDSYSHTIDVSGGYKDCRFQINDTRSDIEDWYNNLGYHIEIYNEATTKIWEGFINRVSINLGTVSLSRGPLLDTVTSVSAVYTEETFSYEGGISFGGDRVFTAAATDSASQDKWGIHETILSLGNGDPTALDAVPQSHLDDNKNPPVTNTVSIGGSPSAANVNIECVGYSQLFEQYHYTQTATAGTATIDDKLKLIVAADPNSIFSTDYSKIEDNTTNTDAYADGEETAMSLIKGMVSLGDSSNNRYIWGVYNDRIFHYNAIPTTYDYIHRIGDVAQEIIATESEATVLPWNIMPGKFMLVSDLFSGLTIDTSDIKTDPRIIFIESVTYTAPWGVAMQGGKFDKVSQQINRLGLGGM